MAKLNNMYLGVIALIVIVVIAFAATRYGGNEQAPVTSGSEPATDEGATPSTHTVEITSSGFSPSTLTINAGDTVTWVAKEGGHRPASAVHPEHRAYPTTGGCIGSTFDACKELAADEEWSFTFDEVGTWKYHDHSNSGLTGTIVVQ